MTCSSNGLGLWRRQGDDVGQTLQQQPQLVFIQALVALAPEIMTDILVELLPQQPVLGLELSVLFPQEGVLRFQCGHACAQFFKLFEQRGIGHTSLTVVKLFCSINITVFSNFSPAIPVLFCPHFQAVNQGAELFAAQTDLTVFAYWPGKPTALYPFRTNPKSIAVPVKHLDPIATAIGEYKQVPGEGITLELLNDQTVEPVETAAQIYWCGGDQDLGCAGDT